MDVEIPANTMATVYLEVKDLSKVMVNGKPVTHMKVKDNTAIFELGSGIYKILKTE